MADGAANQRNCANKRKLKKETRGRKKNSLLQNYLKWKKEYDKEEPEDAKARKKAKNKKSAYKCLIV